MGSTKGIIDVDISQRSQRLSELFNSSGVGLDLLAVDLSGAFFFNVESEVLQKNDLAIVSLGNGLLNLGSDTVVQESHLGVQKLGKFISNRGQRVLVNNLTIGSAQMRSENDSLSSY